MDTKQAAAKLNITPRRVAQLAAAGRFPGAKLTVRQGRAGWEIPDAAVAGHQPLPRGRKPRRE